MLKLIFLIFSLGFSGHGLGSFSFAKAKTAIESINYLPFASKRDGCYARALYMGMELTSVGIPSSNQYLFGDLRPSRQIKWNYHVAPLVEVRHKGVKTLKVFDPSLSRYPISRRSWVKLNRPKGPSQLYVTPSTHYKKKKVQYFNSQGAKGFSMQSRVRNVRQLPQYKMQDIANACKTAWYHIGEEKLPYRHKLWKRRQLKKRTLFLMGRLKKMGKLTSGAQLTSCSKGTFSQSS